MDYVARSPARAQALCTIPVPADARQAGGVGISEVLGAILDRLFNLTEYRCKYSKQNYDSSIKTTTVLSSVVSIRGACHGHTL